MSVKGVFNEPQCCGAAEPGGFLVRQSKQPSVQCNISDDD